MGVVDTASLVVRGLDESVKSLLVARAEAHGRSMEAEVRDILTNAVRRPNIGIALLEAAQAAGGFDEFEIPERSDLPRWAEFD